MARGPLFAHPDVRQITRELRRPDRRIVFFIGAGLSKALGFPLWDELLITVIVRGQELERLDDEQAKHARELVEAREYLNCGDLLRDRMGSRVDDVLEEIFSKPLPPDLGAYEFLVRLPCAGFITTNYDAAIETAYAKHFRAPLHMALPDEPVLLGAIPHHNPFLLKLHGDARRREFVLAKKDYDELAKNEAISRILYSLYHTHRIVFLGYGLADQDIMAPLELLVRDLGGGGQRHVAILPDTLPRDLRERYEDRARVGVCTYRPDSSHSQVADLITHWAVEVLIDTSGATQCVRPRDYARILRSSPKKVILERCRSHAKADATWLLSLPTHWGRAPADEPRAANLAEAMIAFSAAAGPLGLTWDHSPTKQRLLEFTTDGSFVSASLSRPMVQTNALSLYALAQSEDREGFSPIIDKAAAWLEQARVTGSAGWGWEEHDHQVHTLASIWAFAGLLAAGRFPRDAWDTFRENLLTVGTIGFTPRQFAPSLTAAGWILWFLDHLRARSEYTMVDQSLLELALRHVTDERSALSPESDFIRYGTGHAGSGYAAWIHPTAPAVALGAIPWCETHEDAWVALGRALTTLDGQFDRKLGRHDAQVGEEFVPYVMYALWALAETLTALE